MSATLHFLKPTKDQVKTWSMAGFLNTCDPLVHLVHRASSPCMYYSSQMDFIMLCEVHDELKGLKLI